MKNRIFKTILKGFLTILAIFILLMLTPRIVGFIFSEKVPIGYHFELLDYLAIGVGLEKLANLESKVRSDIEEFKNIEYKNVNGKSLQLDIYDPVDMTTPYAQTQGLVTLKSM